MNTVGSYPITASGAAVPSGGNYNTAITYVPGTLTVTDPTVHVTSVTLNKTSMALAVGSSERLTATVSPSNATNMTVTWTSSNGAIARVDNGGNVTAVSAGSATITVTTADGGKTAACTVTVGKDASTLTLTPSTESLIGGGTVTLTLTGLPTGGSPRRACAALFAWRSEGALVPLAGHQVAGSRYVHPYELVIAVAGLMQRVEHHGHELDEALRARVGQLDGAHAAVLG